MKQAATLQKVPLFSYKLARRGVKHGGGQTFK
jgi:hypothetical protein